MISSSKSLHLSNRSIAGPDKTPCEIAARTLLALAFFILRFEQVGAQTPDLESIQNAIGKVPTNPDELGNTATSYLKKEFLIEY